MQGCLGPVPPLEWPDLSLHIDQLPLGHGCSLQVSKLKQCSGETIVWW